MKVSDYFPCPSFRQYQKETIKECIKEFEKGTEIIIIDGPTGFGKSPVNIALGLYFAPSFYTTPQVKLVQQLKEYCVKELAIDGGFGDIIALDARKKYICRASNQTSDDCPIRDEYYCSQSFKECIGLIKCKNKILKKNKCIFLKKKTCIQEPNCTYWNQKKAFFKSKLGITTFANLIVNKYLPLKNPNNIQISFKKRNLLIIDECHSLENQICGLFAGFKISPYSFPKSIRNDIWFKLKKYLPKDIDKPFINNLSIYEEFIFETKKIINSYLIYIEKKKEETKLKNLLHQIEYMNEEIENGKIWGVNNDLLQSYQIKIPHFKPMHIDQFLKKMIWCYADKYLLTSATIPYPQNKIQEWLNRIGLNDKKYKYIQIPMIFPKENRPIFLNKMGGSLSGNNKQLNWNNCIKNVIDIIKKYPNQKGVIHCSSYQMCWNIYNELHDKYSIYLDTKEKDNIINRWKESKKLIIISPTIYEGVDLKDDLCRFQILFKIPYGNSYEDCRLNYLLNIEKDWLYYNRTTATQIIQAYGRGVRHKTDYADFYIIDSAFNNLYLKVEFPEYFKEAIIR